LCGKGLEALVGLEWDGHELFSLDIVGNSKWVDHVSAFGLPKGTGKRKILSDVLKCQ
jgi:hypothetical protein